MIDYRRKYPGVDDVLTMRQVAVEIKTYRYQQYVADGLVDDDPRLKCAIDDLTWQMEAKIREDGYQPFGELAVSVERAYGFGSKTLVYRRPVEWLLRRRLRRVPRRAARVWRALLRRTKVVAVIPPPPPPLMLSGKVQVVPDWVPDSALRPEWAHSGCLTFDQIDHTRSPGRTDGEKP